MFFIIWGYWVIYYIYSLGVLFFCGIVFYIGVLEFFIYLWGLVFFEVVYKTFFFCPDDFFGFGSCAAGRMVFLLLIVAAGAVSLLVFQFFPW